MRPVVKKWRKLSSTRNKRIRDSAPWETHSSHGSLDVHRRHKLTLIDDPQALQGPERRSRELATTGEKLKGVNHRVLDAWE